MIYYLLRTSYEQEPVLDKRCIELLIYLILGFIRKVDKYVSAYYEMAACRIGILEKIMLLELNPLLDLIRDLILTAYLGEILLLEIFRNTRDTLRGVYTVLRLCDHLLIKIRCNNLDLIERNMP